MFTLKNSYGVVGGTGQFVGSPGGSRIPQLLPSCITEMLGVERPSVKNKNPFIQKKKKKSVVWFGLVLKQELVRWLKG